MSEVIFDYGKLRGRIKEVVGTQDRYADAIGLGRVSVSQRLNNQLEFSQREMFKSADVLGFPTSEISAYFLQKKFRNKNKNEPDSPTTARNQTQRPSNIERRLKTNMEQNV